MKDLLSKQERQLLEFYEKHGKTPLPPLDGDVPTRPIEIRLVKRGLLDHIEGQPNAGDFQKRLAALDVTERGLTALRGGEWEDEGKA
jgi:hypothetical protein